MKSFHLLPLILAAFLLNGCVGILEDDEWTEYRDEYEDQQENNNDYWDTYREDYEKYVENQEKLAESRRRK